MIELAIPGRDTIKLEHLVCDVNGTLALDGELLDGVGRVLGKLKDRLEIHLLSADTHGRLESIGQYLRVKTSRLKPGNEAEQKVNYIRGLGVHQVIAVGQGVNDQLMLKEAVIGIAVLSREGLAVQTAQQADIIMPDILSALELLGKPLRLIATLRT